MMTAIRLLSVLVGLTAPDSGEPSVKISAVMIKVAIAARIDHFEDGSFAAFDAVTFQVLCPERLRSKHFVIYASESDLPLDSPLREPGARCSFRVAPEAAGAQEVHWGALEGLRIEKRSLSTQGALRDSGL